MILLAYDIACPKRLRRVAKLVESKLIRVQKSVHLSEVIVPSGWRRCCQPAGSGFDTEWFMMTCH